MQVIANYVNSCGVQKRTLVSEIISLDILSYSSDGKLERPAHEIIGTVLVTRHDFVDKLLSKLTRLNDPYLSVSEAQMTTRRGKLYLHSTATGDHQSSFRTPPSPIPER